MLGSIPERSLNVQNKKKVWIFNPNFLIKNKNNFKMTKILVFFLNQG
jgi:hypothetical protein